MKKATNCKNDTVQLLTVTWARDRAHFGLLWDSLLFSRLASLPHKVIVQTEDLACFQDLSGRGMDMGSTADFLPPEVEAKRRRARMWQKVAGRRGTTLGGSLSRLTGFPDWVRYTGWHTQQLCKLAYAASCEIETVVVLDSDVVVTPHATPDDFQMADGCLCIEKLLAAEQVRGKVAKWQRSAHRLLDLSYPPDGPLDVYYDTPFVLYAPAVRAMIYWLEKQYNRPWWRTLLALPPRRWSEFGIYKTFLRYHWSGKVEWRGTEGIGYLFDASDPQRLAREFDALLHQGRCQYITLHSQNSGRKRWNEETYLGLIRASNFANAANR